MSEHFLRLLWDARTARKQGPAGLAHRQRERLAEMVAFARANSPFYREHYGGLPEQVENPRLLPVTNKQELMARFDDWVTDREVTAKEVRAFVSNFDLVGERFLGKYTVATTSGTTGTPGIFLIDDRAMRVTMVLALRMICDWLGAGDVFKFIRGGRRIAMTIAPGHSATSVAAVRLRKSPSRAKRIRAFPVHTPLPELVEQLNQFKPTVLAPYASIAKLLAGEQEAGRLNIHPVLMVLAAEGLPIREYDRIAKVFDAKVETSYAATECMFFSYGCEERWLHVNSDWAVLEPVDADYRPVPPGEQSHTVLVSNLANRVQPILRYDLGDSILQRPDACPCGNPLPAIRVQGRSAEVLTFSTARDEPVSIPPLALEIDHIPGVELFQIVHGTPTSLRVRLRFTGGADRDRVWKTVETQIKQLLTDHTLGHVTVERAEEPPEQSPGGKYRTIIPLPRHGE